MKNSLKSGCHFIFFIFSITSGEVLDNSPLREYNFGVRFKVGMPFHIFHSWYYFFRCFVSYSF